LKREGGKSGQSRLNIKNGSYWKDSFFLLFIKPFKEVALEKSFQTLFGCFETLLETLCFILF